MCLEKKIRCLKNILKKEALILIIISCFYETNAQFRLTDDATVAYTIDPFTKDIYYMEYFEGVQKVISPPYLKVTESPLPGLPYFSFQNHLAYYWFDRRVYMYNFDSATTRLLVDFNSLLKVTRYTPAGLLSSPNDINLLLDSSPTLYYSFEDNKLHSLGTYYSIVSCLWSSDSTFIYKSSERDIYEINVKSLKKDTLLTLPTKFDHIVSLEYDIESKILAYSDRIDPKVHLFNKRTKTDSVIYHFDNSEECYGSSISLRDIILDQNKKKLAFLVYNDLDPETGIYYYDMDSSKIVKLAECSNAHIKNLLQWLNKDTLTYIQYDGEDAFYRLYGISIRNITTVTDDRVQFPKTVQINGNYPNPFNSETIINFTLPNKQNVKIELYNYLGEKVFNADLGELNGGINEYRLKLNDSSSGVYVYRIITPLAIISNKLILLK